MVLFMQPQDNHFQVNQGSGLWNDPGSKQHSHFPDCTEPLKRTAPSTCVKATKNCIHVFPLCHFTLLLQWVGKCNNVNMKFLHLYFVKALTDAHTVLQPHMTAGLVSHRFRGAKIPTKKVPSGREGKFF